MAMPRSIDRNVRSWPAPMRFGVVAGVLLAVLVLAGCSDDDSDDATDSDPAAVIVAYEDAVNAHDLDAIVAVFATDAVIIGHPLSVTDAEGTGAIRAIHEGMLDTAAAENAYVFVDIEVNGNMVTFDSTFTDEAGDCFPSPGHNVEVTDGRIVRWEFGATDQPCN